MRLIDSHCHLQADRFDDDVELVIGAARLAGVERILVPGWDVDSSRTAISLCGRHPWLDAAAGIHPHAARSASDAAWRSIVEMAADPRVVAIGETGLDYDRVFSPIEDQLRNLRRHLVLALETGKPAILHVRSAAGRRDAQDGLLAELRAAGFGTPAAAAAFVGRPSGVIHSFSGPVDYARAALDLGLAISISGLAFRAGEEPTAEVAALVPADRLLVETDAPYLSPPGAPRRRNAPEWVRLTAQWVRERRGIEAEPFGDSLIAAYDRTFPRTAVRRGPPASA
jgi:TatD DNase family protein